MNTEVLRAAEASLARASELLSKGQVVAMPTETVYGLAADALNPEAVARIFGAKGRPQDNPLIVHIANWSQLEQVVREVPESARILGRAFWPGPLTMILERSASVPDCVTAGLDTVGVRMPSHRAARRLIELSGPLAAPSANTSGKPSPTTAKHVLDDMNGRVPLIIDGGRCRVGVESTVVDMTGDAPRILRPGAITEEMIAAVLGASSTDEAARVGLREGEKVLSPGMKYRHYAPKAPVILYEGPPQSTFEAIMNSFTESDGIICFDEYKDELRAAGARRVSSLGMSWDHEAHGRRLFSVLRRFDSTRAVRILAQCPREHGAGEGAVNRLRKSAGFGGIACAKKTITGVTGVSGSGKSVFCALLAKARGDTLLLDADKIYHELLADPASGLTARILREFPEADRGGELDRKALGAAVFGNEEKRLRLNSLTHGAVADKMMAEALSSPLPHVILDVPLLFESGLDRMCTLTIGLLIGRKDALARIKARDGIDESAARARLSSQPRESFYKKRCDLTVLNGGSLEALEREAEHIAKKYMP